MKILTENKSILVQLAEKLIAQETLEGEELESLFKKAAPLPAPSAKEITKLVPKPVKAKAETKPTTKKKKITPKFVPKQAPAT